MLLDAYQWAENHLKYMEVESWHHSSFSRGSSVFPLVVPRVQCPLSRWHEDGRCLVGQVAGCVKAAEGEHWGIRRSLQFTVAARIITFCRELRGQANLFEVRELAESVLVTFAVVLRAGSMSSRAQIAWDGLARHLLRRSWKHVNLELKGCLAKIVQTFRSVSVTLGRITERLNEAGRRLRAEQAQPAADCMYAPRFTASSSVVSGRDEPRSTFTAASSAAPGRYEPRSAFTATSGETAETAGRRQRPRRFFRQPETARATLVDQPWRRHGQ